MKNLKLYYSYFKALKARDIQKFFVLIFSIFITMSVLLAFMELASLIPLLFLVALIAVPVCFYLYVDYEEKRKQETGLNILACQEFLLEVITELSTQI